MAVFRSGGKFGPFEIRERIGEGGSSFVYRVVDTRTGRLAALKIPNRRARREDSDAHLRELRFGAMLAHRNVLGVLESGTLDGLPFVLFPLGRESLAERLERPSSVALALDWTQQILLGLTHIHQAGIIHCDLKPSNLLLMDDGTLCIADFGVARRGRRAVRGEGTGTPGYMAPEQRAGRPSPRSDLFAVGCIVHELLTGRIPTRPYDGALARSRRAIPRGLDGWLAGALALDASARPKTAQEMHAALGALLRAERRRIAAKRVALPDAYAVRAAG